MDMNASFINILSTIIIFQLAFLSLFLFTSSKGKKISNRILALFFIWLILNLTDALLTYSGYYENFPSFAHLEDGLIFLVGPLIYFYTLSVVYKDFSFKKVDLLHLLPFILATSAYQIYYHLQTAEYQKQIQTAITEQKLPVAFYFTISFVYLHIGIYLYQAFQLLRYYHHKIKDQFSSLSKIRLDWLFFFLGFIAVIFVISVIYSFLPVTEFRKYFEASFLLPFVIIFFFTSSVAWKGMKQPDIFSGIEYNPEEKKYAGSGLSENEKNQIGQKLVQLFNEEKPFLIPDLTIDQLADKLETTSKKLSQVINETFHQNFFDFVNTHRIEEVKKILTESNDVKLTVLEVMYHCGFNSKSSFNTIFRKKTGLTPSEFRKTAIARFS